MPVDAKLKQKVLKGRDAIEMYRTAHTQLHSQPWTPDVPAKHTPLLEQMLKDFKKQGFNSQAEFEAVSEELNQQDIANKIITPDKVWQ